MLKNSARLAETATEIVHRSRPRICAFASTEWPLDCLSELSAVQSNAVLIRRAHSALTGRSTGPEFYHHTRCPIRQTEEPHRMLGIACFSAFLWPQLISTSTPIHSHRSVCDPVFAPRPAHSRVQPTVFCTQTSPPAPPRYSLFSSTSLSGRFPERPLAGDLALLERRPPLHERHNDRFWLFSVII